MPPPDTSQKVAFITLGVLENSAPVFGSVSGDFSVPEWYIPSGLAISDYYTTDIFFERDDFFSLIDRFRDVAILPSSNFGKAVIMSGGLLPQEYSDRYITVTGPPGIKGDQGIQGEVGEVGEASPTYIDGGVASSTYQLDQIIDFGGA